MKKILLILFCLPLIGFGQNVNIPDANFKAYLVGNTAINTNGDTEIQVSEASAFNGSIICNYMSIADLTGIEAFTNLTHLNCYQNIFTSIDISQNTALTFLKVGGSGIGAGFFITSLDVTSNTALTYLNCSDNYFNLTSLDVSNNTALTYLDCGYNQIASLDVSNNIALTELDCRDNELTSLDVSSATSLENLDCSNNEITSLDLSYNTELNILQSGGNQFTNLDIKNGNNTNFIYFSAIYNPNLYCINVDDSTWAANNLVTSNGQPAIDSQHYFSDNCSGTTSIQEHTTTKELLKVTDLLGRETKGNKNEVLFYIYDDGTVEKRIVIE